MSYQVLARKWRPRTFHEMVGQKHVQQALVNALEHQRLHHAYLFTGTRGVGKTSIARILAKCLNCEKGITSTPCGECSACVEIAQGRFVDLIEVDAASRTKVEDTRELLDNVQYAPSKGRFKVYLIDEVHMLTTHSFNALLKTLEEPPSHVKFLLATTDPQKLPVTILSRCLQFNLKNMMPEEIVTHLADILQKETIPFDDKSLWLLGKAANGSMRDALSLTDQAIAYGAQTISYDDVASMLGAVQDTYIIDLINALAARNGAELLAQVEKMATFSIDFKSALDALMTYLHRLCIAQTVPDAVDNAEGDKEQILLQASQIAGEEVQLYYQIAVSGKKEFDYVPSAKMAFEMLILRMLAFSPKRVMMPKPSNVSVSTLVQPLSSSAAPAAVNPASEAASQQAEASQQAAPSNSLPILEPIVPKPKHDVASMVEPLSESDSSTQTSDDEQMCQPLPWEVVEEPNTTVLPEVSNPILESVEKKTLNFEPAVVSSEHVLVENVAHVPNMPAAPAPVKPRQPEEHEQPKHYMPPVDKTLPFSHDQWLKCFHQIGLKGMLQSIVANCAVASVSANHVVLIIEEAHARLLKDDHAHTVSELLSQYFTQQMTVDIQIGNTENIGWTPKTLDEAIKTKRYQLAVEAFESDPNIVWLKEYYGAQIDYESVENTTEQFDLEMLSQ